jgi:hypothetical protein
VGNNAHNGVRAEEGRLKQASAVLPIELLTSMIRWTHSTSNGTADRTSSTHPLGQMSDPRGLLGIRQRRPENSSLGMDQEPPDRIPRRVHDRAELRKSSSARVRFRSCCVRGKGTSGSDDENQKFLERGRMRWGVGSRRPRRRRGQQGPANAATPDLMHKSHRRGLASVE